MFEDERYGCTTLGPVRDEFIATQKFATKYPWRRKYEKRIIPVGNELLSEGQFSRKLEIVKATELTHRNERTNKPYDLSRVDREVAAGVLCLQGSISTTDRNLREFLEQQFSIENITPLGLINIWLEDHLIQWDPAKQAVLQDWIVCQEPRQSREDIKVFEDLAKCRYPTDDADQR
jgi:hypothetical protein